MDEKGIEMAANAECKSPLQVKCQAIGESRSDLEHVQAILFPGVQLSIHSAPLLAARLRTLATEAENGYGAAETLPSEAQSSEGDAAGALHAAIGPSSTSGCSAEPEPPPAKKRKVKKEFDFTGHQERFVALEVLYFGWDYRGYAAQPGCDDTIEHKLFLALRRTKLVEEGRSWQELRYSRCGRTDKGVSALGQVIALKLRSKGRIGAPMLPEEEELDYAHVLNRALPPDIRVLGWTTAPSSFSARFSAVSREYKYFFAASGDLDIAAMRAAAAHFVGRHDFRHFCKVDVVHVHSFVREMLDFRIEPVPGFAAGELTLHQVYVRGTAFLWHQVRSMVAVLFMVGQGLESHDVVRHLLDTAACPNKPQYIMAPEAPLLFSGCNFEGLAFRRPAQATAYVRQAIRKMLGEQLVRAGLLHAAAQKLDACCREAVGKAAQRPARHVKLAARETELPLTERLLRLGRDAPSDKPLRPGARDYM